MQEERGKGDDRTARPGSYADLIADLKLQRATRLVRRVRQLDADRYFAWPGIVRAVVDVPLIVAAFGAVVDRILS
jgi:hypothetical protein